MQNGPEMISADRPNHAGIPAACVERQKGRSVLLKALVPVHKGDVLEISSKENVTLGQNVKKGGQFQILVSRGTEIRPRTILSRIRNELLIEEIRERMKETDIRRPVYAKAVFRKGKPSRLTFQLNHITACAEGMIPEEAKKQPLDPKRVEKQLRKTGNTPFRVDGLEMEMDEGIFFPMQVINELRREAVQKLQEELLRSYVRQCPDIPDTVEETPALESKRRKILSVLIETKEQLTEAARSEDVDRIYLECHLANSIFASEKEKEQVIELYKAGNAEWYLAFPHVFRERAENMFDRRWEQLETFPWSGALVRNLESVAYLQKKEWKNNIIADHHLYTLNKKAKEFLKNAGINGTTVSLELNSQEIREVASEDDEIVVYGYAPMMISAGCVKKSTGHCDGREGLTKLKDRYQKIFYIKNYCDTCYNIIYNSAPLVLLEQLLEIERMGISDIRLHFTLESGEETKRIIQLYGDVFWRERKHLSAAELFNDFTRGHYKRGIK